MIDVKLTINQQDIAELMKMSSQAETGLLNGLKKAALLVEAEVKKSFGKPNKPKVKSGRLRQSIKSRVVDKTISVGTDVVYGRIQEEGGIITPKNKPYLAFQVNGNWVKKTSVTVPARPYLEPGIAKNMDKISEIIVKEILEEINA